MNLIKTNSYSIYVLEVPKEANDFKLIHNNQRVAHFLPYYKRFDLPSEGKEIIGKLFNLKQKDFIKFINPIIDDHGRLDGYEDYTSAYILSIPKESFLSLLMRNKIMLEDKKNYIIIELK